jgi:hypothetical protein
MVRKAMIGAITVVAALLLTVGVDIEASSAATISLTLPQSTAFSFLGHSCGGIQEQVLATGFDASNGYPTGDVYLQTRCGGSGRGGGYHTTTYSAWASATWDYAGAVIFSSRLAAAPTGLDPALSVFDAFGNEVFNQLNAVNVAPSECTVDRTTYCAYRAYLTLAQDFIPPPRVTSISVSSGPASGGTSVTIAGTGFTGALAVGFGDVDAASFMVNSDSSIMAVSPAEGAGTVDVTVTTAGGTSAASSQALFTFIAPPTVSSVSPNQGPVGGGTTVTITGTNFTDAMEVDFGETPAAFTVNDDTSITATAPAAEEPDTVHVTVATEGGTSATSSADRFTYSAAAGCGAACAPTVYCGGLTGTLGGTVTLSGCRPRSGTSTRASWVADTFVWKPSGETTTVSLEFSSPGQGRCPAGSLEYDISGTVVGGTSTYVSVGDPVSAQICVNRLGRMSLVRGTKFGL